MKPPPATAPDPDSQTSHRSHAERIARVLRQSILDGETVAGTPLRQDGIARQFGVSHIPVREALRHLAAEGLVTIERNRGATVADLSPAQAQELLEVRAALETLAVRCALPRADGALVARAGAILAEAESTADVGAWMALNWHFHAALYERAQRPRLLAMIGDLQARVDRFVRVLLGTSDYREQAQGEHRAILAAYSVGNAAAVCSLLDQHLQETATHLAQLIERHRDEHRARRED